MDSDGIPSTPEVFETVYLNAEKIHFEYHGENLTFTDEQGEFYSRVTLRRAFPLSLENRYILVRTPDSEMERGREIGVIRDLNDLRPDSREAVERELRQHYFVPRILKIQHIREEFGFLYWKVITDRGKKEFIMRDSIIGSVRRVAEGRWLVIDINQTRYEIYDWRLLDEPSRDLLQRYLLL
jgi:hypothetical protein